MRKLSIFLISVLCLIIVAEIIAYFTILQPTTISTTLPSPTPLQGTAQQNVSFDEQSYANNTRINIGLKRQGILTSSASEYIYQYEIVEVEIYPEPLYIEEAKKTAAALIKYKTLDGWVGITITPRELTLITLEDTNSPESLQSISDLKAGDNILYKVTFDPLLPPEESIKAIHVTRN